MSDSCIGEPVSHLRLERYLLKELTAVEREQIDTHLSRCAVCSACFAEICNSTVDLAPLSVPARAKGSQPRFSFTPARARGMAALGLSLAAAAALLLVVRSSTDTAFPPAQRMLKGGSLALELVRERNGDILHDARVFAEGDRFQARITCPLAGPVHWELVVFQGEEAFFPLHSSAPLRCGNSVSLPGAFVLTGKQDAVVCVVLDPTQPPERGRLSARDARGLPNLSTCATLHARAVAR